jgi:hypothetical protein
MWVFVVGKCKVSLGESDVILLSTRRLSSLRGPYVACVLPLPDASDSIPIVPSPDHSPNA